MYSPRRSISHLFCRRSTYLLYFSFSSLSYTSNTSHLFQPLIRPIFPPFSMLQYMDFPFPTYTNAVLSKIPPPPNPLLSAYNSPIILLSQPTIPHHPTIPLPSACTFPSSHNLATFNLQFSTFPHPTAFSPAS
jgi:hypothetical protein